MTFNSETDNFGTKTIVILLNAIIAITLIFASYGVYAQEYRPNSDAIATFGNSEYTTNNSDKQLAATDNQQIMITKPMIMEQIEPIDIVLYKFAESTPQPMTYYTDLLEIHNNFSEPMIVNIRIENIIGQEYIGTIIIWLFENQTNTPNLDTPLGYVKLTNTTASTVDFMLNHCIKPNSTNYIELGGFASINAPTNSKINFSFAIEPMDKDNY